LGKKKTEPSVRVAPIGELKIYQITENELDELERGSPASYQLTAAIFFLGLAIPLLITLLTLNNPTNKTFTVYVLGFAATALGAVIFFILWGINRRSSKRIATEIRDRMPPQEGIQVDEES